MNCKVKTDTGWKKVVGYPVYFKGYEMFNFFIYQMDGRFGLYGSNDTPDKLKGKWVISEKRTGLYGLTAFTNPEEAHYKFNERLKERYTPELLKEKIQEVLKSK